MTEFKQTWNSIENNSMHTNLGARRNKNIKKNLPAFVLESAEKKKSNPLSGKGELFSLEHFPRFKK